MSNKITKAYRIKLKNRRVYVQKTKSGVVIAFVKLDVNPAQVTIESKRNRHVTTLGLSFEAGHALCVLLGEIIKPSDIEKEEI